MCVCASTTFREASKSVFIFERMERGSLAFACIHTKFAPIDVLTLRFRYRMQNVHMKCTF